jgi:hypothetical protein
MRAGETGDGPHRDEEEGWEAAAAGVRKRARWRRRRRKGRGMGETGGEQGERGEEGPRVEGDGVRVRVGCCVIYKETR